VEVDLGYLSNPREEQLLASGGYRQKLAEALAAGILAERSVAEVNR
jgi:N-acetylmuramoyl-L-alanine amidase